MPQRALQPPRWSLKPSPDEIRGTRPAGVSSHSMNPGTFSVIAPPPAEVGGPQQGGLSVPSPASIEQTLAVMPCSLSPAFLMLLILRGPVGPLFTCSMQLFLLGLNRPRQPWPPRCSGVPAIWLPIPARMRSCVRKSGRSGLSCRGRSWPARHCRRR